MKGFALDNNGDVIIEKNQIKIVKDDELIKQTVQTVIGTNKTEWFLNIDEGINFNNLLGKKKDDEIIKNEILQGIQQVDNSFLLESFECNYDRRNRKLLITFKAKNSEGKTISGNTEF